MPAQPRPKPSVILIREYDQQLSGSGCCGRLEGDFATCGGQPVFAERRAIMERMGPVYRRLKDAYGDAVEVQVIDPRNVGLIVLLIRDCWTFRVGVRSALATLLHVSTHGVVVNGRLVDRSDHPDPERIVALVGEASETGRQAARARRELIRS